MRVSEISRKTKETQVIVSVDLDGEGNAEVDTGTRFFDHLLQILATHSWINIKVIAKGDLEHHIIEDVAICIGKAVRQAIGEGERINRFGYAIVPMDCSLAFSSIDLVKRPCSIIDLKIKGKKIEDMTREDIIHFLQTFSSFLQANVHVWVQYGENDHHKVEAAIKALALAFRQALTINPKQRQIPSSKGVI